MPRRSSRPRPERTLDLPAHTRACPACSGPLWSAATARRTVVTLEGLVRLRLQIRSCRNPDCLRHRACLRPEQEGRFALPQHEFGRDVIALVGRLRHAEHRSVPEVHAELVRRGVPICVRSVGNLLDRYDERLALSCTDAGRLKAITAKAGRVILAIDGLQPDVGHEVLWVIRDVLSGEVLLARSLLSSTQDDLAGLLAEVRDALGDVPIAGVVSDGQTSIRNAVKEALDGVPHQRCQFRYLREAATPVYEADRHIEVQLKKKVRGIRPIEREVEGREDEAASVIRGYCAAVRSALTDDGRPPLDACGLKPRTNNDLEQFFGSYRYHERRCSGRKVACPGTVVRGSVRLVAAAATRLRPIEVADLMPSDPGAWRELRRSLGRRHEVRALGRRFRRDPVAYLRSLEDSLIKQVLPP